MNCFRNNKYLKIQNITLIINSRFYKFFNCFILDKIYINELDNFTKLYCKKFLLKSPYRVIDKILLNS